jgi:hypothetical protein
MSSPRGAGGDWNDRPDETDPAQVHSHRVMEAIKREYASDPLMPRFVVVIEYPKDALAKVAADGRIALASTGDDPLDTHRLLALGIGACKAATRRAARRN